ncbi:pleckstrin homology domain-containing family M member 2 isoform X2 [Protopterus annectens]|uniref:pleckstrin homology domain-containing family M member 2 isoform X2 n=1 Tax=Protopterus annectens TaxID=7888 RepID=UPI001CFB931B|nr:pleckstrin homology domain-containing family M member 2 isoform X2 [Protopterus annectens]
MEPDSSPQPPRAEEMQVKDRILENISQSVKKLQSYFAACEDETPAIKNHDKVLQRLCEHLDHALLYGLQDISLGYWVVVIHFTRREAIKQIEVLSHLATNMGRSRAWLYLALNENSLESYLRLFQENQTLLHKYYYRNALVCSHDHLTLFLTLVSGLEFIRFNLDLDVPYLDLAPYMPDYYKPQHLLDFEDRFLNSVHGSDSLSLNSLNSVTSTNLEWDDSAIAPSSEDGELTDIISCPHSATSDMSSHRTFSKSPTQRFNPFNEEKVETVSSAEVTPVHTAYEEKGEVAADSGTDYSEHSSELEVIRLGKKKKVSKKKKRKLEGSVCLTSSLTEPTDHEQEAGEPELQNDVGDGQKDGTHLENLEQSATDGSGGQEKNADENKAPLGAEHMSLTHLGLCIPAMKDTSMDSLGKPLSEVIDKLNGALDPNSWKSEGEHHPDQSFRTCVSGEAPDRRPYRDFGEGIPPPLDFYRFTPESPCSPTTSSGDHDPSRNGQSSHVPSSSEAPCQTTESTEETHKQVEKTLIVEWSKRTDVKLLNFSDACPVSRLSEAKLSVSLPNAEDSGIEEEQNSPSEMTHPSEFRVDNNLLLMLMIHVFKENEEQLYKMIRMSTGHMEGNQLLLYVLLTDCYIYLLRKGEAEKPYSVEETISYNELDYISVGLDYQTVMLVCTNRRRQFLLDTADASLTEFFLAVLKSAMIKGCREPPYPSILTDATMEKLALAKFVAQESKCESKDVVVHHYGLIHWEDPMDITIGPHSSLYQHRENGCAKEGVLYYRAGITYLGREQWKPCFVVLSNGVLYQYADRTDVIPVLSVNMGSEQCGGCRRSNTTERPHAFQVILTDRPSLELSAADELEMADWMQHLCQAVSKGVIPQGVAPSPCIPCCLVVTDKKLFSCHEDCQTSFFRLLGNADLADVTAVSIKTGKEYCILEFAQDRKHYLPPWVLYFSCISELERFLGATSVAWRKIFQVDLPRKQIQDASIQKKCEDAMSLMQSAWQRSDSLCRGRSTRDPWC